MTAIVCTTIGASAVVAVQASASGGGGTPPPSAQPAPPKPGTSTAPPPVRPLTASGQLSPATTATNAHCGQTITASLTLNGDLFCGSGPGLTVTGNSVTLNLGGHEIAGSGSTGYTGVTLSGTTDTVTNGLVTSFYSGVWVNGVTDTVSALRATNNYYGVVDYGQGTKITNIVAATSTYDGIYSDGTGGTYSGDHEVSSSGAGLLLYGQKTTITGNIANGNTSYGIHDQGFANKFTTNTADFNGYDGIYIAEVAAIDGAGNTAKGNDTTTGQKTEQCYGIVCG